METAPKMEQTNKPIIFFLCFFVIPGTFRPSEHFCIFLHFPSCMKTFNFNCQFGASTIPVVEDKSLKTQYQVSYVCAGGGYVGGPSRCEGEPHHELRQL